MPIRTLLLFGFFWCFLISCSGITVPSIKSIDTVTIVSTENGVINLKAGVTIENNNKISISGKDLRFILKMEDTIIGTGLGNESFVLKGKSTEKMDLEMQLYIDSIPQSLRLRLFEMDSIPIDMSVSFKGVLGLEHQRDALFKLPMEMLQSSFMGMFFKDNSVQFKDLKLESTNQTKTVFKGNLEFTNPIPMDIELVDSDVHIYSQRTKGVDVGDVTMEHNFTLFKDSISLIPCTMNLDNGKALGTGLGKILTGSLDYFAQGPLDIKINGIEFKIPLDLHFTYNPLSGKITVIK